jgi:hypothetical protein
MLSGVVSCMRRGSHGDQRETPSAVAAGRPLSPLTDRLEILGVGTIVIGVGFFLLATVETPWSAQGPLLFEFLLLASAFGAGLVLVSTPRLRASLEQAHPVLPGVQRRSRPDVLLRTVLSLACMAVLVAVMQVVAGRLHINEAIVPGIFTGDGGVALWYRSTVGEWQRRRRQVVLAQAGIHWGRVPLYVMDTPGD